MIEFERTFLAKCLPGGLAECRHKEIIDIYFPASAEHPVLRLRKNGEKFELTKKTPTKGQDASEQLEQTIMLSKEEFEALSKLEGKRTAKERYYYNYQNHVAEIDVFKEKLRGIVWIDFEFSNAEEKDAFQMPDFCLADVTQEKAFAGGMVCGKSYADLEPTLKKYGYKKIALKL